MGIVPVIISNAGKELKVNVLLDECSTDSYRSEHVATQLCLGGTSVSRTVAVLCGAATKVHVGKEVNIELLCATDRKHMGNIHS
jgi:hypothetical protein